MIWLVVRSRVIGIYLFFGGDGEEVRRFGRCCGGVVGVLFDGEGDGGVGSELGDDF